MKKLRLAFLLVIGCVFSVISQQADNSGYVLSIKETKPVNQEGRVHYDIPVELHNTSKDTLYYLSMSCSWQDFYSVDNDNFEVESVPCDHNVHERLVLPPRESHTVILRVFLKKPEEYNPESLRIGHNLIKLNGNKISKPPRQLRKIKNIIWSNAVTLPLD